MTKPLQTASIAAPGFYGLNTQDSGVNLDSGFATEATNCVIDKFGRIGARKGWQFLTESTGINLEGIHNFVDVNGNEYFGAWTSDNYFYIWDGSTLTAVTYSGIQTDIIDHTADKGNWQSVTLNDAAYLFQRGFEPIYFSPTANTLDDVSRSDNSATVTITHSGTVATVTQVAHGLSNGTRVTITGADQEEYNSSDSPDGYWEIFNVTTDTYDYTMESSPGVDATGTITAQWSQGTPPEANTVISAYGRLWAANTASTVTTLYWSDLLDGTEWAGGTAGSNDISSIMVKGNDEIVGLGAHNGYLIAFGKKNIIIFGDNDGNNQYLDPTDLRLIEVINGVGCIARDSIQNTGTDILFLSESGVRSLGRTIQEKSQPMRDLSKNVRDDIVQRVTSTVNTDTIKSAYSESNAFYLLAFTDVDEVYCFDMRSPLQDGSARVTVWDSMEFTNWNAVDGEVYMTHSNGLARYFGYTDNNEPYSMKYYTNYFDMGNPSVTKMLKRLAVTVIGASGQDFILKSAFDYSDIYNSFTVTITESDFAEYNVAEYGLSTTTEAVSQGASTVTDDSTSTHYTVDFSTTSEDDYDTEYKVYLDADTYYYIQDSVAEDRTLTTLYVKSADFTAEYAGGTLSDIVRLAGSGSGTVMQIGMETDIDGGSLSIQKLDIYVKQGRML